MPSARLRLPPGDDAAVTRSGLTLTTDLLIEGVHFDNRSSPADVGYKAVAVSASDLAATGARPEWMLLSLAVPGATRHTIEQLAAGIAEACAAFGAQLVGGDTTSSPGPWVLSVAMGGSLVGRPLTRSAARPGQDLWVAGHLGLAGAGYRLPDPPTAALAALRRPHPPVDFALDLCARGLIAAGMDVSDGLATDAARLARASGVALRIERQDLPLHPALRELEQGLALVLDGGDDYALLFTAEPGVCDELCELADSAGIPLHRVGCVEAGRGLQLPDLPRSPWQHFPAGEP